MTPCSLVDRRQTTQYDILETHNINQMENTTENPFTEENRMQIYSAVGNWTGKISVFVLL
jgi:hypothetical protein